MVTKHMVRVRMSNRHGPEPTIGADGNEQEQRAQAR